MSGFFSKTHEQFPQPEPEPIDYSYCTGKINNISFSGLTTYDRCPYQLYLSKVDKIGNVSGPAADRGSMLHDMLEKYVKGEEQIDWTKLKSKVYYESLIEAFKEDYENGLCITELKYAITKDLKQTKWDAKNMWHRGAIDVVIFETSEQKRAAIYDYKSGRNSNSVHHRSQLMLYSMIMFMLYPKLQHIQAAPIYIDHCVEPFFTTFERKDLQKFWPRYEYRFKRVTESEYFPANPTKFACRWCQHNKVQEELGQTEPACKFGIR